MSWLRDLVVRIKGDKTQLDSTLKGAEGSMTSFGSVVTKIGGLLAAVFSVGAIVSFSKEAAKLAAEAEGVKNAFMKIGSARSVLEDMKRATRGVIDESDLMALAVKAQNFNIPLKDLSKYLEFATNRAITTGKSISELAELIVTGLGRKSSQSFIQLGLSASDVQKAMKETGGMMNLVTSELDKMGPVASTTAVRMETLTANITNFKEAWGEFLNNSSAIKSFFKWLTDEFEIFASKDLNFWQKINGSPNDYKKFKDNLDEAKKARDEFFKSSANTPEEEANIASLIKKWSEGDIIPAKQIETLTTLNDKLKQYKADLDLIDISNKTALESKKKDIAALEHQIKLLGEYDTAIKKVSTSQLIGLPQNNVTTSVFGKKTFGLTPAIPNKTQPYSGTSDQELANQMAAAVEITDDITDALDESQLALVNLADTFAGFFSDVNLGFQGMIDGVITGIKRLVAELVAKAVILAILNVLLPGAAVPLTLSNIIGGGAGSLIGGKATGKTSSLGSAAPAGMSQTIKIVGNTVIQGKDLAVVWGRYNENNS